MNRKSILNLIYKKKLCENLCTNTFPWGWKSKKLIEREKNTIINSCNDSFYHNYHSFNSNYFLEHSKKAYNVIYKNYLDNIDFLDEKYTTPSLSIALNNLRKKIDEYKIKDYPSYIDIKEQLILTNDIKYKSTTCNFKILGVTSKKELEYNLFCGLDYPDSNNLKSQHPTTQIIKVLYLSNNFYDILEWERDLLELNPEWKVSNINNIL